MAKTCLAYFDASVRGEHYYIGYVIYDKGREVIVSKTMKFWKGYLDRINDSNMAEYLSLLELLKEINRQQIKQIRVIGDNQSVIWACLGKAKVNPRYKPIYQEILELKATLEYFNLEFTRRKNNKLADKLCRQAYKADKQREVAACI